MSVKKKSWIERVAEKVGIIPELKTDTITKVPRYSDGGELKPYPDISHWDDLEVLDSRSWPAPSKKRYMLVPTTCFNCESACGLTAYIDREEMRVVKFEGNPHHPGSRGRNCAKGPATINQITDPDRILYPLKRKGKRGEGKWERISWEQALDEIAARIRQSLLAGRRDKVVYHVGRPGHEGYANRVLQAWGVDGHNSHTNICSAGARTGYALWYGYDRPSPDHANARFILLISAHLESGHYFNPHAQRIIEGKMKGAKLCVMDPRLSNTASMADYWLPTYPGTEVAVMLAWAKIILEEGLYNREFMRNWVNWKQYMKARHPDKPLDFDVFIQCLIDEYKDFTVEFASKESGIPAETIREIAYEIARAGTRFATHTWRSASIGNLGGWTVSRALHFLCVLVGSVGTRGGTSPNAWNKFKPQFFKVPPPIKVWNELHFPPEYPLAHFEMSFILPHMLKEGRGSIDVYFTRVFNPVWTYPDGFSWIEMLLDEEKIGMHIALTPTWNETAYFADYVLPMGHASERHDLNSYETHNGVWIAFRQPVLREAARRMGKEVRFTYEVNPGEVWEEDEFWIELSWKIDPDGSLGIREQFISPYREGEKITIDEYYQYIFERVPGLPEAAKKAGFTGPFAELEYMRKYGAFEVEKTSYNKHLKPLTEEELEGSTVDPETDVVYKDGKAIGVMVDGKAYVGFPTPSRKNELYSQTMVDWKWPEYALPCYIKSHIHRDNLKEGEYVLLPNFRLPVHIHSRSANAKWLAEIAHRNPIWMHPDDAKKYGFKTGDLVKIVTDIGHFVDRVWVTHAIRPGVVACSHHLGRWRRKQDTGNRWLSNVVQIEHDGKGRWKMSPVESVRPFKSSDKDSARIFWLDGGVHQNLTHAVHPDPVSGHHAWLQRARIEKPGPNDKYGDVVVDTNKSMEVYREWLKMTRPAPGPNGLRRPLWLKRPLRPVDEAYYFKEQS